MNIINIKFFNNSMEAKSFILTLLYSESNNNKKLTKTKKQFVC